MRKLDITGQRFGFLVVSCEDGKSKSGRLMWRCLCDCGRETRVDGGALRSGNTKSCGCHKIRLNRDRKTVHRKSHTAIYAIWVAMKSRCENTKCADYRNYGGRGITVCERWRTSFASFYSDMGDRPEGKSLDRINNDLGYGPENCRWASQQEQSFNRRHTARLTINGITRLLVDWANDSGLKTDTLRHRIHAGISPENAIQPPKKLNTEEA